MIFTLITCEIFIIIFLKENDKLSYFYSQFGNSINFQLVFFEDPTFFDPTFFDPPSFLDPGMRGLSNLIANATSANMTTSAIKLIQGLTRLRRRRC